jgi:hypothetical protein
MKQTATAGTPVYARQHSHGLTLPQQNAVDLLAAGNNDTETAKQLGLSRTAVTKWRLYDVTFQAALNRRRAEIWGAAGDKLRALIPQALDALADAVGPNRTLQFRMKAAVEILKLAGTLAAGQPTGPLSADEIIGGLVQCRVKAKREELNKHLSETDRLMASLKSPSREEAEREEAEARAEVLAELEGKLAEGGNADGNGEAGE